MRRFFVILAAVTLLLCMALPVSAANSITSAQTAATVFSDGGCQVNMSMTIHLEEQVSKLYFPVPENAASVSLNGSRVNTSKSGGVRRVDLSRLLKGLTGDLTFSIQYSLRDVISLTPTDSQQLELPLLCGFDYGIQSMEFTVTLPGAVEAKPAFSSGYHKSSIEADLMFTYEGMTITGQTLKELKDHETLTMTLAVSDQMFPRPLLMVTDTTPMVIAIGICAALALVYWLLTLRHLPLGRQEAVEPPEGYDAGAVGSVLALQGVDLSLRILSWAQLGYLTLRSQKKGAVLLCKRMDMGNERSTAEQRCFQKLFQKGDVVDTGSLFYARLQLAMGKKPAGLQALIHKRTGSTVVFRGLCAGIGVFCGAGIGLAMGSGAVLQWFLVILFGVLCGISCWWSLPWATCLGLRHKKPLLTAAILCAVWLVLSGLCGEWSLGLYMLLGVLFGGILLRLAGRRTALGKQTISQLAGLRYFLKKQTASELAQRGQTDPDYFFRMIPYAIALGVDKPFAKAFGRQQLGECPYVTDGPGEGLTAATWLVTLRKLLDTMEQRAKNLPAEKALRFLHNLRKG